MFMHLLSFAQVSLQCYSNSPPPPTKNREISENCHISLVILSFMFWCYLLVQRILPIFQGVFCISVLAIGCFSCTITITVRYDVFGIPRPVLNVLFYSVAKFVSVICLILMLHDNFERVLRTDTIMQSWALMLFWFKHSLNRLSIFDFITVNPTEHYVQTVCSIQSRHYFADNVYSF